MIFIFEEMPQIHTQEAYVMLQWETDALLLYNPVTYSVTLRFP